MTKLTITLDINAEDLYRQRLFLAYLAQFDIDEYPIDGLQNLTDVIADELSENDNNAALLTETTEEDEMGMRMIVDLRQKLNFKPPALKEYMVKLVEQDGCLIIEFLCHAEDATHAHEQAENAYAGCTVQHVLEYVVSHMEKA